MGVDDDDVQCGSDGGEHCAAPRCAPLACVLQSIGKTYEQIVKRLQEDRVGFDNQLVALERTVAAKGESPFVTLRC